MTTLTLVRAYQHSFDSHPNTTLAFTGGCLNAIGDTMAQLVQNKWGRGDIEKHRQYDFQRTARFFAFGMGIIPIMGRWIRFLERRFPLRSLHSTNRVSFAALSKRVACDQLIMAPCGVIYSPFIIKAVASRQTLIQLVIFLGSMGVMERRSPRQIGDRFRDLYRTVLLANRKVWPLAQMINFRYMPLAYRVPFAQSCGMMWTLYLSLLSSGEDTRQDRELALQKEMEDDEQEIVKL